ncbi:alpha-mannosidase [Paenibacillus protaetiae]|uniref:Alpha-mannosidase n=1 Tax=Paenibacillus protaetiae TaxID=2509456 RepID=A0A4P6EVH1_9BACL|nr:glycoside hydrolase family 38 C-terminal domain-containing protein [Paenibacillus protaetiae]QAY67032.1 alpha-mannosidase [Paenibacillus protaetiae]
MINGKQIERTLQKVKRLGEHYSQYLYERADTVEVTYWETMEHLYEVPAGENWQPAHKGTKWGSPGGSIWFKGTYRIPERLHGQKLYIEAKTDAHETMLWVDGTPRGIYNAKRNAGQLGFHTALILTGQAEAGRTVELAFEGYAGKPIVGTQPYQSYASDDTYASPYNREFDGIYIHVRREDVNEFLYDVKTLVQIASAPSTDPFRKGQIVNGLIDVFEAAVQKPEETEEHVWRAGLAAAIQRMKPLLAKSNGDSAPSAGIIGHSHMDTAWLWTRDEVIRKCARTYANALNLMEHYPEYVFIQSSPFHAELMRRHYPAVFEGIVKRVAEGRWEPTGGSWIEPDCNLTSGESLIRQFLKGQRYTRKYFNYTADTFWLPDTFGYSAAIPQMLKGVGITSFLTTKLSWNDTNRFPYDSFIWKGLDGTPVLTHFNHIHCWPDAETIIGRIYGSEGDRNDIQHKQVNDRRLISYGYGDGGGGPHDGMLEAARRLEDVEGVPKTAHTTVSAFMEELRDTSRLPVYAGELYFEGHRGTLTQMAQIKRNNRKAEIALRDLEMQVVLAALQDGRQDLAAPKAQLEELEELLLINQFHDILPGTSIPEVHDRAIREVGGIIAEAEKLSRKLRQEAAQGEEEMTVWNTLSWARRGQFVTDAREDGRVPAGDSVITQSFTDLNGRAKLAVGGITVPALSHVSVPLGSRAAAAGSAASASPFKYDGRTLQTPFAAIVFDEHGYMTSFTDLPSGRELVRGEQPLNALLMGEDVPLAWDNWDIDQDSKLKLEKQTNLLSREVAADGPLQFRIRSVYRIGSRSELKQDIVFYADDARIDFETVIDWKDRYQLLKAGFDVQVLAGSARHEVQFGHVERPTHRNTVYDQAMFEVCNHKWTDLSENRFGVAVLNDCKYGISVEESDIRLTLHKGGCHPDPRGDEGVHEVTYSFLPHNSGFQAESVIRPAYELNMPLNVSEGRHRADNNPLFTVDAPNVIVEAVKPAEEENAYIVRLYEAERSAAAATLSFGHRPAKVAVTNMLEEEQSLLPVSQSGEVKLQLKAFEIVTLKVQFS